MESNEKRETIAYSPLYAFINHIVHVFIASPTLSTYYQTKVIQWHVPLIKAVLQLTVPYIYLLIILNHISHYDNNGQQQDD